VIVQRLTDYIWVGLDSIINESHITQVARAFNALKASLKKLTSYYESLDPTDDVLADSRYFPSITAYRPHGGGHVKFEYVGFLENSPDCITLHARTETMTDIVVKFVDRYGQRAHQILADQGLAPKLLYCGSPRLNDNEPTYQSISMVVMEYVDGDTFAVAKPKDSVETVRPAVERALKLLHSHGLVFGDLRPPNVMITKGGEVKLIDFNWAGEEGQAKYPPLISPEIAWPEGVEALAVMRKEHDLDMLRKLI
jgi:serine/threonine protein kinase